MLLNGSWRTCENVLGCTQTGWYLSYELTKGRGNANEQIRTKIGDKVFLGSLYAYLVVCLWFAAKMDFFVQKPEILLP